MIHNIDIKRIFHTGLNSFSRNSWLSAATIVMMTMVLFLIGGLIFLRAASSALLVSFSDKVDVSVYIKSDVAESEILKIKKEISSLAEVRSVDYISQDEALSKFREVHKDNALILNSLAELDKNPLQASLNIKAKKTSELRKIADYLQAKNFSFVDKINFYENKVIIERLAAIVGGIRSIGVAILSVFAAIAVIIAFNTIRLAIYSKREEIQIMKLVGASRWHIRGPFIIEGMLHGVISALVALVMLLPVAFVAGPKFAIFVQGFDLFAYFQANVFWFFAILLAVGITLGVTSSMIAMRRYLREV